MPQPHFFRVVHHDPILPANSLPLPQRPHIEIPGFRPHALLRGGHAQTLSGLFFPGDVRVPLSEKHCVKLADGDSVVLHDDRPANWQEGGPTAVLVHGLTGSGASPYMIRAARKLVERGIRAFRMDLRSCGAGWGLARRPYHAGCSDDIVTVVEFVNQLCGGGDTSVIGYSLGGNIVLKLLGEDPSLVSPTITRAVAVNPCIDLAACSRGLERPIARFYARHFVTAMCQHLVAGRNLIHRHFITQRTRPVRRLREFDDLYTSRLGGYSNADEYYDRCSSAQFMPAIQVPTLILAANDDPLIPVELFKKLPPNPVVQLHLSQSGGHLGFIGRGGVDADRRWMDWRIIDWVTAANPAAR